MPTTPQATGSAWGSRALSQPLSQVCVEITGQMHGDEGGVAEGRLRGRSRTGVKTRSLLGFRYICVDHGDPRIMGLGRCVSVTSRCACITQGAVSLPTLFASRGGDGGEGDSPSEAPGIGPIHEKPIGTNRMVWACPHNLSPHNQVSTRSDVGKSFDCIMVALAQNCEAGGELS
jgi:hypothetical protein